MKKIALLAFLATSLVAAAQATIVGFSVGYLADTQDPLFTVRAGGAFSESSAISHQGEFEIGFTRSSETGIRAEIMPLMLNYRAEFVNQSPWAAYLGFGGGVARSKVKVWFGSNDDWSAALQGFAGATYKLSANTKLLLGARYLWIDDVKLFNVPLEVGDDVSFEVGLSFKF
jgi:opacity protein-like surface antigen